MWFVVRLITEPISTWDYDSPYKILDSIIQDSMSFYAARMEIPES